MTELVFTKQLYTEAEAAALIGIKARSLRTERQAGRIGYKRSAGRIMYRPRDLRRWLNEGIEPCHDETKARILSGDKIAESITSATPRPEDPGALQRLQATSAKLKKRSAGSSPSTGQATTGRVIRGSFP